MTEKITNKALPVIILAAGLSERMGLMKPLLKFDSSHTFIDKIIETFKRWGCPEIIVVVNKEVRKKINRQAPSTIKIILNQNPSTGRMDSLKLGINALKEKSACFIHNADNPFINTGLLDEMIKKLEDGSYVVPVMHGKGGHPILISRRIVEQINIDRGQQEDIRIILSEFPRIDLETQDEKILCNINTLDDFWRYFGKQ